MSKRSARLQRQNRQRIAAARKTSRRELRAKGDLPKFLPYEVYDVVVAPPVLGWTLDEIPSLLEFLGRIRRKSLEGTRPLLLDLIGCTRISGPACLMLAAEIERCKRVRPQSIAAREPKAANPRWVLGAYGLHDRLQFDTRVVPPPSAYITTIVSGGMPAPGTELNPGELTFRVAQLAKRVFGDEDFADHVHSALNEASDNVIGHAYEDAPDSTLSRWWMSCLGNPKEQSAYFFVYDQGATIPVTAPKTFGERMVGMLAAIGIKRKDALDHHILKATIQQRRTQTGQIERGKGLGHMVGLIDDSKAGTISIFSGSAYYLYTRKDDIADSTELSGSLGWSLPGTLVVWEVIGGAREEEVQSVSEA